ncbi:ANTAR domain-containing protein [Pseudarthrobacter chlorophenolicus]|uniref:ANTAR domain-containing protein n=1 Tax=Pseudarthrobacter chlorophenolicus TaxID=85085 RepID=UPI00016670D5|nr:GAF and ANTAR domain-containing protein [Pseudarthrobacter chlorophenolicus]
MLQQLPVRSLVTSPLIAGSEAIGSLMLYASGPHTYGGSSGRLLELFAAPAATLIAHIQARGAPHKLTEGLRQSLYSRDVVNRACGVLMERLGIPQRLRAAATHQASRGPGRQPPAGERGRPFRATGVQGLGAPHGL